MKQIMENKLKTKSVCRQINFWSMLAKTAIIYVSKANEQLLKLIWFSLQSHQMSLRIDCIDNHAIVFIIFLRSTLNLSSRKK